MPNYYESLELDLDAQSEAGARRHQVLASLPWAPKPTTSVGYLAGNRLLIVADNETALEIESSLPDSVDCYIANPADKSGVTAKTNSHNCAGLKVTGYLGNFTVDIDSHLEDSSSLGSIFGLEPDTFDQVLDCSNEALVTAAIKPPGYYHAPNEELRDGFLESIPEMTGEFEKPKYFDYDPSICAHGRSGISGCNNCLNACPTDAIVSLGETIEVNPHLCQGGGSCTASCPTGAITYLYPRADEQVEFLRVATRSLRENFTDSGITLLVYDDENGRETIEGLAADLAGHVLPFRVEEIGSVGLDIICSALAYGANQVLLHVAPEIPAQVRKVLEFNQSLVNGMCAELGLADFEVTLVASTEEILGADVPTRLEDTAAFAAVGGKRTIIRNALTHLWERSGSEQNAVDLPAGSPFGNLDIKVDACTLCMGCVSQCPGKALQAGGDTPALRFIEANCVQCGICTASCPESALSLQPRLNFIPDEANRARPLKEEAPFHCISCGKAFATQAMIARMTEKLQGHWMFEKPEAVNRLRMCEDCRVIDMFDKENQLD